MSGIPILLEAAGLRVLAVGGGPVATRKVERLVQAGASVHVVAPIASDAIRRLEAEGRLTHSARAYVTGDIADAQLVIAAADDRVINAAVTADARAAHRLVNVADAPEDGSFATMATHRSGPLVIAISAGGVPGAALRIRDAIAARFDERYARALSELATVRRSLLDEGEGSRWRMIAHDVIDERFCDVVEHDALEKRLASCL